MIERLSQVPFQITGGSAQRGLRDPKRARSLGKRTIFDDRNEAAHLRSCNAAGHDRGLTRLHPEFPESLFDLCKEPLCPPSEHDSELIEITSASSPLQQANSYLGFKLRDRLGNGGLGKVAFFRRAAQAAQAGNTLEQLETPKAYGNGSPFRIQAVHAFLPGRPGRILYPREGLVDARESRRSATIFERLLHRRPPTCDCVNVTVVAGSVCAEEPTASRSRCVTNRQSRWRPLT